MKTIRLAALVALAGVAIGGGASFATGLVLGPPAAPGLARHRGSVPPTFVATGKILAPLVAPDGHLAGYVQFEAQLETAPERADFVKLRLPLLLHAINMRTYRTPMTSGPDGMLPDLDVFRKVMLVAAAEAFGPDEVKRVAIIRATPA